MSKVKKTLYNTEEMLKRFREEAESMISGNVNEQDVNLSQREIKDLLHQIQVQHIELEMQNDELKIANQEVELQRHKFAGLYDLAPVGYFILDKYAIITEVNTTGCNLLGSVKRTILNRRFQGFIRTEDGEIFHHFFRRTLSSKTKQSCLLSLITPKGDTFFAQIEAIAVTSQILQKEECYITVIDITERRKAELKLKETKDRLEMALDASVAGTWQLDLKTEEITLDEFSCEIYGLPFTKATQSLVKFIRMIHPADRRNTSKRFGEAIGHKWDLDAEYRIIKPDESIAYISARGHVLDHPTLCFTGILLDITERKLLENEAMILKAQHQKNIIGAVFRTQENERKRISEALHDSVSQLLYGIKLKLQDYKQSDKDHTVHSELNVLIEQAVNETRNISFELAPSILTDFGLTITLEEMANRLTSTNLKINTRFYGFNKRFDANKELSIFRIIQELVNNVIKHAQATEVSIELFEKNKTLNISVTDNGKGFDNTGIHTTIGSGLHSIKNRLDLLNGSMNIKSADGAGTIVYITFKDII